MSPMIVTFALTLLLFFGITFFVTWWMRGRGFGELFGPGRSTEPPPREAPGSGGRGPGPA